MARIRSVHPSLFTDEAWVSCAPLTRLLYIGLWTDADDQGLFEWKPLQIKMRLLPGDAADVVGCLAELSSAGLIGSFEHAGKRYGAIKQFRKYQRPKKPNSVHFLPEEWRSFVALDDSSSEPEGDEPALVPPRGGTEGEKSPQMEDGGGKGGDKGSEANASSVAKGDGEGGFEALWKAYPHVKGRSSKPLALAAWVATDEAVRASLADAAARYAKGGTIPPGGAPALGKWLEEERWMDWLYDQRPNRLITAWTGPPDFRKAVVELHGEDFARSWLDSTVWQDVPERSIICRLGVTARRLSSDLRKLLAEHAVTVKTERAA